MIDREAVFAAKRLVEDETFMTAIDKALARMNHQLLHATTPEDRERKFQEYSGLSRVVTDLKKQAIEASSLAAES